MEWKDVSSASEAYRKKARDRFSALWTTLQEKVGILRGRMPAIKTIDPRSSLRRASLATKSFFSDAYSKYAVRGDYSSRSLLIIFVVAIFLGILVKASLSDVFTIGFEDYTLAPAEHLIDLNAVQHRLLQEGGSLTLSGDGAAVGPSCSQ